MIKTCFALLSVAALFTLSACGGAAPTPATPDANSASSAAAGAAGDSDSDGVPDSADKCNGQKEDGQAPDPKDGCPKT
ncbi:MAG TPA: hypothetical protein VMI75_34065 [Polyangiaceae bacterium]|nr:hypothetical protein [Polyangiaceae bacterium]